MLLKSFQLDPLPEISVSMNKHQNIFFMEKWKKLEKLRSECVE